MICRIPVDVPMDVIKASRRGGQLKDVCSLQSFRNGIKQDSESVLLEFEDELLPK